MRANGTYEFAYENAVDIHINTNAKDLSFKVTDSDENAFLSAKNMDFKVVKNKLGKKRKDRNSCVRLYKNGIARDRCEASRKLPECTSEKTTNTIEVSDEKGVLMSTCTVWVKECQVWIGMRTEPRRSCCKVVVPLVLVEGCHQVI